MFEVKKLRSTFGNCCLACDVCMKEKSYFCKVVVDGIFSLERRKSSMLLILFSFIEVKIRHHLPENSMLIFGNQFHLCQFIFQRILFPFQQIKSQKQSRS